MPNEQMVCGYSYDHTEQLIDEDEHGATFECTECGVEWTEEYDDAE